MKAENRIKDIAITLNDTVCSLWRVVMMWITFISILFVALVMNIFL
ncbi:MAG: hypothetical protein LBU60_03460 [Clostridiales bacterium]|nr:hypothetical protein [Clostridiales bacterium]